ncbi:MAG: hypothetical protein GY943_33110 [Chloroflexi bacterium]|nr:hypothetical protein [Chloroflexota bacterium]
MKKYKLLIYDVMSRRVRWKLLAFWLFLVFIGIYDLVSGILGSYWFILWLIIPIIILFWVYYTFVLPRAWVIVTPSYFLLKSRAQEVKVGYGRIDNVTSTQLVQHYSLKNLKGQDKVLAKPHFKRTCTFIEFTTMPKVLEKHKNKFPCILFSPKRPGLLLVVDDWMTLNREIESARHKWRQKKGLNRKITGTETRTLAAQILDL